MSRTDELLWSIAAMRSCTIYAIDESAVDVDELLKARPGGFVWSNAFGGVMAIESRDVPYDAVAGWISEEV